jgi:hypothetical protein
MKRPSRGLAIARRRSEPKAAIETIVIEHIEKTPTEN